MTTVRCAIYTRKSSEEGLEQDFNSLDAQREACAAYILSQASEGWKLVPERYDDGGLSGGSLERPALKRLLADVAAGAIDTIVVYKVDRLTRSLLDFSKLVEAFDKAGTSFVSVTQSFNTTTSMGRLTLNMLLSFAQFEREVTAERIRDKIAASKAKGMWMGGTPPLGYRPDGRSLAIVEDHASLVRSIFERYLAIGHVRGLHDALRNEGIRLPVRSRKSGTTFGGGWFSRGQLYTLLSNAVYIGEIPHRDTRYPGTHAAIIEREVWDAVQARLAENKQGAGAANRHGNASLLAGKVFTSDGTRLVASHACKGSRRYRYYVSNTPTGETPAMRVPAGELERAVRDTLVSALSAKHELLERLGVLSVDAMSPARLARIGLARARIAARETDIVDQIVQRVEVSQSSVTVVCCRPALLRAVGLGDQEETDGEVEFSAERSLRKSGRALRLIEGSGKSVEAPQTIIGLMLKARGWWGVLRQGEVDVTTLAASQGVNASYLTRVVRLAFLSPQITAAILAGEIKAEIKGKDLLDGARFSGRWHDQARWLLPKNKQLPPL